jgi:hypothetical protein
MGHELIGVAEEVKADENVNVKVDAAYRKK